MSTFIFIYFRLGDHRLDHAHGRVFDEDAPTQPPTRAGA